MIRKRLFSGITQSRSRNALRAAPRIEELEAREVPAAGLSTGAVDPALAPIDHFVVIYQETGASTVFTVSSQAPTASPMQPIRMEV